MVFNLSASFNFGTPGQRVDPVRSFNFVVTLVDSSSALTSALNDIQNAAMGGFSECSGLEMTLEVEDYQEGGRNEAVLKFPTRVQWTNIKLRRGVVATSSDLWDWLYRFVEGDVQRRDGVIVLQDESHAPAKVWKFTRGLPVKWTGPTLNATQTQVAMEELELAHEGLELSNGGAAGPSISASASLGGISASASIG